MGGRLTMIWGWISTGLVCLAVVERAVGFFIGPSPGSRVSLRAIGGLKSQLPRDLRFSLRILSDDASLSDRQEKEVASRASNSEPANAHQYGEEEQALIAKIVGGAKDVLAALEKDATAYSMMKFNENFLFNSTTTTPEDDGGKRPALTS